MTAHETPIDKAKAPDAATVLYVLQQIDAHLTGLQLHHGYPEFLDSDGWQVALERVRHFIAKALDEAQQRCSANPEPRPAIVDKIMRTTGATEAEAYEAAAEGKRIAQAMIAATGTPAKPVPNTIAHLRGWLEAIISDAETVEQKDAFARRALMNEPDPVTELLCPAKASITTDGVEAQITEVISRIALDGKDADALLHALVERVQRDAVITERRRALEMGQPVPCSETATPDVDTSHLTCLACGKAFRTICSACNTAALDETVKTYSAEIHRILRFARSAACPFCGWPRGDCDCKRPAILDVKRCMPEPTDEKSEEGR